MGLMNNEKKETKYETYLPFSRNNKKSLENVRKISSSFHFLGSQAISWTYINENTDRN